MEIFRGGSKNDVWRLGLALQKSMDLIKKKKLEIKVTMKKVEKKVLVEVKKK